MRPLKYLFLFSFFLSFSEVFSQKIPTIYAADLENMVKKQNDTTYVLNFWATWCAPCVRELPHFEKAQKQFAKQKVKMVLISLDFAKDYHKLALFAKKRKLQSEIFWLNEPDGNVWIDKIWADWQGEIPATLVYRAEKYKFFQAKELTEKELFETIRKALD